MLTVATAVGGVEITVDRRARGRAGGGMPAATATWRGQGGERTCTNTLSDGTGVQTFVTELSAISAADSRTVSGQHAGTAGATRCQDERRVLGHPRRMSRVVGRRRSVLLDRITDPETTVEHGYPAAAR